MSEIFLTGGGFCAKVFIWFKQLPLHKVFEFIFRVLVHNCWPSIVYVYHEMQADWSDYGLIKNPPPKPDFKK